jgi:hypothetical protein
MPTAHILKTVGHYLLTPCKKRRNLQNHINKYWPVLVSIMILSILAQCYSEISFKEIKVQEPVMATIPIVNVPMLRLLVHRVTNITVTYYHATIQQCDNDPNITADGSKINPITAGSLRYCALSRDLLKPWGGSFDYGDVIKLEGAGLYSGYWTVRDTMPLYQKKRIDLLFSLGKHGRSYEGAVISKKEWVNNAT